jgi:Methyltransferase domain
MFGADHRHRSPAHAPPAVGRPRLETAARQGRVGSRLGQNHIDGSDGALSQESSCGLLLSRTAERLGDQVTDERSVTDMLAAVRDELRVARTIPSTPIVLRRRAVDQAVDYILSDRRFDDVRISLQNPPTLNAALNEVTLDGTLAEFGVYKGRSLTQIAKFFPDRIVHGFDSFVGLPDAWGGKDAGAFDIGEKPPELTVSNVEFHVGWFDDTVPAFARQHSGPFAFAHLDADLYSSTKTVFDNLSDWFVAGTVVVFDEYFGFHGWQHHEHKAFHEFLSRTGLSFEAISLGHMNLAVRLTDR